MPFGWPNSEVETFCRLIPLIRTLLLGVSGDVFVTP